MKAAWDSPSADPGGIRRRIWSKSEESPDQPDLFHPVHLHVGEFWGNMVIHIHGHRYSAVPHNVLQHLRVHPGFVSACSAALLSCCAVSPRQMPSAPSACRIPCSARSALSDAFRHVWLFSCSITWFQSLHPLSVRPSGPPPSFRPVSAIRAEFVMRIPIYAFWSAVPAFLIISASPQFRLHDITDAFKMLCGQSGVLLPENFVNIQNTSRYSCRTTSENRILKALAGASGALSLKTGCKIFLPGGCWNRCRATQVSLFYFQPVPFRWTQRPQGKYHKNRPVWICH